MMFDSRIQPQAIQPSNRRAALRAIGWHELTARINAARDLRRELNRDSAMMTASFSDAAAGYFANSAQSKRDVNPYALGPGKACDAMDAVDGCDVSTRDAREIHD